MKTKLIYSFLLVLILAVKTDARTIAGKVISISDGDTFTMLTEERRQVKIRLHGVDCPEKNQAYGQKAKDILSGLIFDKTVEVEVTDIDRYGRTVGVVYIGKLCVNETLLIAGYAWHYTKYDKSTKYAGFERLARKMKSGLWADDNPTPPWEFRKRK